MRKWDNQRKTSENGKIGHILVDCHSLVVEGDVHQDEERGEGEEQQGTQNPDDLLLLGVFELWNRCELHHVQGRAKLFPWAIHCECQV